MLLCVLRLNADRKGMEILQMLTEFLVSNPKVAGFLATIGAFRIVMKPLYTFIHSVVEATPTPKDNELLEKVEASKYYKGVVFVADYLLSVKLPGPKK
jgi:hypothetical protein